MLCVTPQRCMPLFTTFYFTGDLLQRSLYGTYYDRPDRQQAPRPTGYLILERQAYLAAEEEPKC
jgi:hypothetical protein